MDALLTKKLVENEAVFRKYNEKVESVFDELKQAAVEEGHNDVLETSNLMLDFFCECSDEACVERVSMKLKMYSDIHEDRKQFTIVPHHEAAGIEEIVKKTKNYYVVRKAVLPPSNPTRLHKTPLNNV